MRVLPGLVGGLFLTLSTSSLVAAGPAPCNNDDLALQKSRGQMAAQTHAANSFNGDCHDGAFQADLISSIPQPNLRDARSDCYRQGYQNGVTAFLATLSRRCDKGNACFDNGAAVGEYGARIFCDSADKAATPVSVGCFSADSHKCQDAFLQYVIANCPQKPEGETWRRKYCSFPRQ